jgi:hypothetical protein
MSDLPDNWEEIKSDKAFWDEVKRMIAAGELHEAQYYEETVAQLISGIKPEPDDEEFDPDNYEEELHLLAIAAVINSKDVFGVFYNDQYGEDNSSSVNELAGKFYVANWDDPKMIIGPFDSIHDGALQILHASTGDGFFTGAYSDLPIEEMRKLCESAVPMSQGGGSLEINDVMHVMTKDGLVPA